MRSEFSTCSGSLSQFALQRSTISYWINKKWSIGLRAFYDPTKVLRSSSNPASVAAFTNPYPIYAKLYHADPAQFLMARV